MRHLELRTYDFHDGSHWDACLSVEPAQTDGTRKTVHITPCLKSPDGTVRGWSRAEIDAVLGEGAELRVDVAWEIDDATEAAVRRLLPGGDDSRTGAEALAGVEELLSWDESLTCTFRAVDWPLGRPLHLPLHAIDSTRVYLRLALSRPNGDKSEVRRLRVHYPNLSFDRYLPAIYREDAHSARFVRSLMAIYESLFGNLENDLARLPANLDPATAPPEWVSALIRWLGLPPATELTDEQRKELLKSAGDLLRGRGTRASLARLLRILVGSDFAVLDRGASARPWILPRPQRPNYGSRLGEDTWLLSPAPEGVRLGVDFELDGERHIGVRPVEARDLFAVHLGLVEVRIALSLQDRVRLEPLLHRYLRVFVPAHCRYELKFVPRDELPPPDVLDENAHLCNETDPTLGESARLGHLRLPERPHREPRLGDDIRLCE